jgi:hypothetical protein
MHHLSRKAVLHGLLLCIREQCQCTSASLPVLTLHGMGGVGKSTMAAELAHCPAAHELFPDGVLWATLGPQPQIGALLNSWVRGVGERSMEAWSEESATAYLRTVLRERRALLVVDDAWRESDTRPFLVGGRGCCVVVTTRRAAIADQLGATYVPMNQLEPEESILLMARRSGRAGALSAQDAYEARLLTEQLGHLPLAIELAAALVARRYNWVEARQQLISFEDALPADVKAKSHARRKIEACLGLSLAVLRAESAQLWQAFAWLSLFPYEETITDAMAATLWSIPHEAAQHWLHALEDDALLRRTPGGYSLHGLLHRIAGQLFRAAAPEGLGRNPQDGHKELVQRYRATAVTGRWADIQDDGYIIDRLVWHLAQAKKPDAIFELLATGTVEGSNRWYQRRTQTERLAGYLDDLRIARQVALHTNSRSRQVFVALCQSSVLSVTANYTAEIVFALVRGRVWSIFWAFRWAQSICVPHRRIDCLLALCAAGQIVDPLNSQTAQVARQALQLAQSLISARSPTEAAVQLMGRAVSTAAARDLPDALVAAFAWCNLPSQKARLMFWFPISVPQSTREGLSTLLGTVKNPLERILVLNALIRSSSDAERERLYKQLLDELVTALPACVHSAERSVTKAIRVGEPASTLGQQPSNEETSVDTLCKELASILSYFPNEFMDQAASFLNRYEALLPVRRLLETLARFRNLSRREAKPDASAEFQWLNSDQKRKRAAEHLIARGDPAYLFSIVNGVSESGWEADDLMLWLGTLPTTLEPSTLQEIANTLSQRNPQALCPRLLTSPASVSLADLVRRVDQGSSDAAKGVVLACLLYGAPSIAAQVLAAFSSIDDREDQARALLAIMPFLPRSASRHQFFDLQNAERFGVQIAGMTTMMVELCREIDPYALAEVVEATSKNQAEWWVVEALSVTLLRLRKRSELQAIVEAAPRIRNADLRARLLERTAIRLVDLRFDELSIDVARSIDLPDARWAALHDLAVRFASTGNVEGAKQAANLIVSRPWAQKTYVDVAFELGALDMNDTARQLVREQVVDEEWRDYAAPIFLASAADSQLAATRHHDRTIGESRLNRFQLINSSAQEIAGIVGSGSPIEPILEAARNCNLEQLESAVCEAWRAPGENQEMLCDTLSRLPRPSLLVALAQIAPTLDVCADSGDVVRIVEGIGHVSRWWP